MSSPIGSAGSDASALPSATAVFAGTIGAIAGVGAPGAIATPAGEAALGITAAPGSCSSQLGAAI